MIKDAQVCKLRPFLGEGHPLYRAVLKVGMDAKSARKYRHADCLLSESLAARTWRTREDPFQDVFDQIHRPSQLGASDFTHMNDLRVTLTVQPFDHMVYHFVLTYSQLGDWHSLRPPDLWDSVVEPSSGFGLRRRLSTRVAAWCRDR